MSPPDTGSGSSPNPVVRETYDASFWPGWRAAISNGRSMLDFFGIRGSRWRRSCFVEDPDRELLPNIAEAASPARPHSRCHPNSRMLSHGVTSGSPGARWVETFIRSVWAKPSDAPDRVRRMHAEPTIVSLRRSTSGRAHLGERGRAGHFGNARMPTPEGIVSMLIHER